MYTCCVERINYDEFFDSEFTTLGSLGRRSCCSHFASDMLIGDWLVFADIYPKKTRRTTFLSNIKTQTQNKPKSSDINLT